MSQTFLHIDEVFPTTRLLGRCHDCRRLLWQHDRCEWACPSTGHFMWPLQRGACLFCDTCATAREDARGAGSPLTPASPASS